MNTTDREVIAYRERLQSCGFQADDITEEEILRRIEAIKLIESIPDTAGLLIWNPTKTWDVTKTWDITKLRGYDRA